MHKMMKCLLGVLLTGVLTGTAWRISQARADKGVPIEGHVAQLPVVQTDGSSTDVAGVKGWKVLYFWSDSCPCVKRCEQVNLIPLSKEFKGQVSFYGVASNGYNVRYRAAAQGSDVQLPQLRVTGSSGFWPPYPVVIDAHHQVADTLGATFTPEVYLLSPDNRLVYRGVPDDSKEFEERTGKPGLSENYLRDALVEALAGKKVSRSVLQPKGYCAIDRSDVAADQPARPKSPAAG